MKAKRRRSRRGMTLIEVMLVLAILVIIAGMVGVGIMGARARALPKVAHTQLSSIETMLNLYLNEFGHFPTALGELRSPPDGSAPIADKDIPPDPWGQQYNYQQTGNGYRVWSVGADGQDGTDDDVVHTSGT